MRLHILFLLLCPAAVLQAQTIKVGPYLQNASPNSIHILWESDIDASSFVQWGTSQLLGNSETGTSMSSVGSAVIHDVILSDLDPSTTYFYRVTTGTDFSEVHRFKTPPLSNEESSFRFVAMSDMQRDGSHPDKFDEIIHEGVIDYLSETYGGALSDNLALVMIPGDLVPNGNSYSQWEDFFFTPSADLFSDVPLYPVPGNHENNATLFFQYFNLPDNGLVGEEEHAWVKDYGNIRIIGLDSNGPYRTQEQLDWMEERLSETCETEAIDFVFAQLHHPHKSELWTPGESDYTGDVITLLEDFSTSCGKPSIHFFGHTHGYSRGQSRDHRHLWINVASAGGAIDLWGEWPQMDYEEFSVSQDEWGFVVVDVTAGPEPEFTVRRLSRGNQNFAKDNELTDSITVKRFPDLIETPTGLFPVNEEVSPDCVVLQSSDFETENPVAQHGQSHWQVSNTLGDFSSPVIDIWKNHENWYFGEDTQSSDDLTDQAISGLEENQSYWWRVKHRDRGLSWSDWSPANEFTTGSSLFTSNLLVNSGAEEETQAWTAEEGAIESLTDGECAGISPFEGERYFAVGGVCDDAPFGRAYQDVDVSGYGDFIDEGNYIAQFGGHLSNFNGSDLPEMRIVFLTDNNVRLDSSEVISSLSSTWTSFSTGLEIPADTKTIRFELSGTRNAGSDNDSYFDELFLTIGSAADPCQSLVSCPADINGDGMVDVTDFLELNSHYGSICECPADIDGSGVVDINDFLVFNTAFGQPCSSLISAPSTGAHALLELLSDHREIRVHHDIKAMMEKLSKRGVPESLIK